MKKFLSIFGYGWSKWETVESNVPRILEVTNPILGVVDGPRVVYVDIQRRENSVTGKVQYKNVRRY